MNSNRLIGIIKSAEFAQCLSGVKVVLLDSIGKVLAETDSDNSGTWQISSSLEGHTLLFEKPGYVTKEIPVNSVASPVRLLEDRLIGYQDKLWFRPGDNVSVYVNTSVPFKASLFRHGEIKKKIQVYEHLAPCSQKVPDGYFVDKGLDWQSTFDYSVPHDAMPGLYSLLLEAEEEDSFAIPMVVSTPSEQMGKNRLLVLASTNTWQAYNVWGGRSRYLNYEDESLSNESEKSLFQRVLSESIQLIKKILPPGVIVFLRKYFHTNREKIFPWMFEKLSIQRPFTNCDLEGDSWDTPFTNHLAGAEWRILAWLEKKGIGYDIVSGWELDHTPNLLEHYKAILLSTHCEYWSCNSFETLKRFHENNGLWVLNLSGNTMYRQVENYEDGSLRCVSPYFKETCGDESQLTGVRFTDYDYGTCAPFKIIDNQHWIFSNVNINKEGYVFGKESLNRSTPAAEKFVDPGRPSQGSTLTGVGASGWETDKVSKTASEMFKVVAKGMNSYGGADIVVKDPDENSGGVLSIPSIVFGASLVIDPVCSTIVENALNRAMQVS